MASLWYRVGYESSAERGEIADGMEHGITPRHRLPRRDIHDLGRSLEADNARRRITLAVVQAPLLASAESLTGRSMEASHREIGLHYDVITASTANVFSWAVGVFRSCRKRKRSMKPACLGDHGRSGSIGRNSSDVYQGLVDRMTVRVSYAPETVCITTEFANGLQRSPRCGSRRTAASRRRARTHDRIRS